MIRYSMQYYPCLPDVEDLREAEQQNEFLCNELDLCVGFYVSSSRTAGFLYFPFN